MDINEMIRKQNKIVDQITETTTDAEKKELTYQFFDAAIDMWNTEIAGPVTFANGNASSIPTL